MLYTFLMYDVLLFLSGAGEKWGSGRGGKKEITKPSENAPAAKVSKPAPKNPRKNNKKANNAEAAAESRETSSSFVFEMGKPRLVKSFLLKISHSHYFIFETLVRLWIFGLCTL